MKNRNRMYTNGEITIFWRAADCVHNTQCYRNLRSVFDPSKRPWVNPDGAESVEIKRIIEDCPTDALTFKWNDNSKNLTENSAKLYMGDFQTEFLKDSNTDQSNSSIPTTVNIRPNGPIVISGDFSVIDSDGKPMKPSQMVSLCRCGQSRNLPFCDGMHFKVGFKG